MSELKILKIGSKIKPFVLENQDGVKISSKDYLGQYVLLYFYPKAMTPGCTVQACGLRDSKKMLDKKKIAVFGISCDPVVKLKKFYDRDQLNFDLLSDADHKVADQFGVWGTKKFMGRVYDGLHRVSFIINPKGVIEHVINPVNTKTHHEDVLALLE